MSFPKYPKYKASGVEWLGDVPEGWEVSRLKRVCHVFPSNVDKKSHDGETPVKLCNYTDVYYNETITADMEFMAATASTEQIAKFTLRAGDTIITKDSETANDIAIGAYVPADLPGVVCGYHLSMIRPMAETNGAFIKRLFDSVYVKGCVEVRANGLTRVGLGQYEIDNLDLPFPSLAEQVAIAAFLDRETAKIDGLVAEQKRLMELLKEKRQAVISHAVTKGLDPHAKMKPSGVEWLGDVPEHWEVKRLKYVMSIMPGFSFASSDFVDEGVQLIRIGNLYLNELSLDRDPIFLPPAFEFQYGDYIVTFGDLLMSLTGTLGKKDYGYAVLLRSASKFLLNQRVARLRCRDSIIPKYAEHLLQSRFYTEQIHRLPFGTKQANLSSSDVLGAVIPLPPMVKQIEIANFLDSELSKFDTLTAEAERAIDLLQERRTALISAAVTGQIDVRKINTNQGV